MGLGFARTFGDMALGMAILVLLPVVAGLITSVLNSVNLQVAIPVSATETLIDTANASGSTITAPIETNMRYRVTVTYSDANGSHTVTDVLVVASDGSYSWEDGNLADQYTSLAVTGWKAINSNSKWTLYFNTGSSGNRQVKVAGTTVTQFDSVKVEKLGSQYVIPIDLIMKIMVVGGVIGFAGYGLHKLGIRGI